MKYHRIKIQKKIRIFVFFCVKLPQVFDVHENYNHKNFKYCVLNKNEPKLGEINKIHQLGKNKT